MHLRGGFYDATLPTTGETIRVYAFYVANPPNEDGEVEVSLHNAYGALSGVDVTKLLNHSTGELQGFTGTSLLEYAIAAELEEDYHG